MDQIDAPETMTVAAALETAVAHQRAGRLDAARRLYEAILAAQPKSLDARFDALHMLGVIARRRGDPTAAIRLINEALAVKPGFSAAYINLAGVLLDHGQIGESMKAARTALLLNPAEIEPSRILLRGLLYQAGISPEQRLAAHLDFAARHQPPPENALSPPENDRSPDRRLRIGVLSADLIDHPVGRNLLPWLRNRDHGASEIIAYAELERPDPVNALIRSCCDGWRSTSGLDDRTVAEMIRRDCIDVLVVLAAHFNDNRPLVACYRPTPVQVSMFDCATMALRAIDYWVTDPVLNPPDTTERFVETLAYLPVATAYEAPEDAPPVAPLPALTAGGVTFGSFNNPTKIGDTAIALWARVLRAVPRSNLLLKYAAQYANAELRARLCAAFGAHGVDPRRLDFRQTVDDQTTHRVAYGAVDIALDTTPFNGSTTTFEALWMGVPVITLAGDTMVSRMSASLLSAVGLDDLSTASSDAFVERAAALAGDISALSALRAGLRARVARSPLCDGPAYARSMDSLWRSLWRAWCVTAS